MKQPRTAFANHTMIAVWIALAIFMAFGCSSDSDSDTGGDIDNTEIEALEDGDSKETMENDSEDGDFDTDEFSESETELDEEEAIEEEIEPEKEMEFDPSEIDFEAELPEFEIPEPGVCDLPIGNDRCRWCGLPCEENLDCPNGYSCDSGECTRECWPDVAGQELNDCGEGWSCHLKDYRVFGMASSWTCARGSGVECVDNSVCAEDEVCGTYWPNLFWNDIAPFCTKAKLCSVSEGEACEDDRDCDNLACRMTPESGRKTCSAYCDDDSDCAIGRHCRDAFEGSYLPPEYDFPELFLSTCHDPNQGLNCSPDFRCDYDICKSDKDCTVEGEVCGGKRMDPYNQNYQLVCHRTVPGGLAAGETCSFDPAQDMECANTFCIPGDDDNPICSKPCNPALADRYSSGHPECQEGFACYKVDLAPNPYDLLFRLSADGCLPQRGSMTECSKDTDCSEGEICAALSEVPADRESLRLADGDEDSELAELAEDQEQTEEDTTETDLVNPDGDEDSEADEELSTRLQGHCVPEMGQRQVGEICNPETFNEADSCVTGFCYQLSCSTLCVEDGDCPENWACREVPAYEEGGVWEQAGHRIHLCIPPWLED